MINLLLVRLCALKRVASSKTRFWFVSDWQPRRVFIFSTTDVNLTPRFLFMSDAIRLGALAEINRCINNDQSRCFDFYLKRKIRQQQNLS